MGRSPSQLVSMGQVSLREGRRARWALVLLGLLALFAFLGNVVWNDPIGQDLGRYLEGPSLAEPLGRDHLGRSAIARLAAATRLSVLLSLACVTTALVVGGLTGVLSAWRGGWIDGVLHGLSETMVALPSLLLVLVFSAMADGGIWTLYLGLALAQWVEYFRVVRSRAGLVLGGPAVEAATSLCLGPHHVLVRHLWPELRPVLLSMAGFGLGTSILALSTLGFVGVGIRPPTPELGAMITEAFPLYAEAPRLSVAPVVVLGLLVLGVLGLRPTGAGR